MFTWCVHCIHTMYSRQCSVLTIVQPLPPENTLWFGHNFVSKYYILCLKEIPTTEKKSITQSQLTYRLLTTWICIENLFSSCYMPSVDISTIKIRSNTIQAYEKISFWGLKTFPYFLKILSKIGNKKPQKTRVCLRISQRCNLDLNGFKKKNV